jgi:hypothetical protein
LDGEGVYCTPWISIFFAKFLDFLLFTMLFFREG